jgi:hypothetical protein
MVIDLLLLLVDAMRHVEVGSGSDGPWISLCIEEGYRRGDHGSCSLYIATLSLEPYRLTPGHRNLTISTTFAGFPVCHVTRGLASEDPTRLVRPTDENNMGAPTDPVESRVPHELFPEFMLQRTGAVGTSSTPCRPILLACHHVDMTPNRHQIGRSQQTVGIGSGNPVCRTDRDHVEVSVWPFKYAQVEATRVQHKQTAKTPILQRCELLTSMSKIVDDPSFQGIIPESFLHGYSSASYQVEGGYQQDGRGLSVWDENLHDAPTGNGNVACDSYNLWQEDVKLLQQYGATGYRFSISWSRVIPLGEWVKRFASSTLQPDTV